MFLLPLCLLFGVLPQASPATSDVFPPADPAEHGIRAETLEAFDHEVKSFVEREWIVGAELLVVKDRRTVFHGAYGWRDREEERPMERNTIFNLRSMTKPLVGAAAQMLVDEGKLGLDQPVAVHLPAFATGESARITLEQLLTHRSGLPDTHPSGPRSAYPDLRAVADYWGRHGPTAFAPGTDMAYSDPGADVLGALVAAAAETPLEDFVTERLFGPLGMQDSFALTDADDPRAEHIASGYLRGAMGWKKFWTRGDDPLMPFVRGAGDTWYSTPKDYARFLALWMDGGRAGGEALLSSEAVRRALRPVSPFRYNNRVPGLQVYYGHMWLVYAAEDDLEATPPAAFGHSGTDGTYAWAWPAHDLMVLYFTQSRGQLTRMRLEALFDRLLVEAEEDDG